MIQPEEIIKVKQMLNVLVQHIPDTLRDVEKQADIGLRILPKIPPDKKRILMDFVNRILLLMREYEASDIDFGGVGCEGQIWARIMGLKRPVEGLSRISPDDFSIIIQNILNFMR